MHTLCSKGTAVTWWEEYEKCPAFVFLKSYHPNKSCWEPDVKIESGLFISVESVIKMLIRCFYVYYTVMLDSLMCFLLSLTVVSMDWYYWC